MKTYAEIMSDAQSECIDELTKGLEQCTPEQQELFKKMYAKNMSLTIEETVFNMEPELHEWAMKQVQATLDKANESDS